MTTVQRSKEDQQRLLAAANKIRSWQLPYQQTGVIYLHSTLSRDANIPNWGQFVIQSSGSPVSTAEKQEGGLPHYGTQQNIVAETQETCLSHIRALASSTRATSQEFS